MGAMHSPVSVRYAARGGGIQHTAKSTQDTMVDLRYHCIVAPSPHTLNPQPGIQHHTAGREKVREERQPEEGGALPGRGFDGDCAVCRPLSNVPQRLLSLRVVWRLTLGEGCTQGPEGCTWSLEGGTLSLVDCTQTIDGFEPYVGGHASLLEDLLDFGNH